MAEEKRSSSKTYTNLVLVGLAIAAAFLGGVTVGRGMAGKTTGKAEKQASEEPVVQTSPAAEEGEVVGAEAELTLGRFTVLEEEACEENGRPLVYFFGSESCSYCRWEHPVFEEVADRFGDEIAFHNNMDDKESDAEVFEKYYDLNGGGIPFMVLGCQYARVGAGSSDGEEEEAKNLTALICKLTDGQP